MTRPCHRLGATARALVVVLLAAGWQAPARAETLNLTPDEALMTARAAFQVGEFGIANRIAHALLLVDPRDPRVHLLLAATEPRLGNPDAGLTAGRKAWAYSRGGKAPKALRFEIARNTAKAALEAGRPLVAQYWLRRSLDVAPDAAAFAQSGQDLQQVRSRSPWRMVIDLEAGPSDNLNGGADSSVFKIGDFVLGHLSQGSEALSGARVSLRVAAERALPGSARAQTVLSFSAETVRNQIDRASRDKAGDITSRDLDRSRLSFGIRRDLRVGPRGLPASLSVELGHNWSGGQAIGPSLGFAAQGVLAQGAAGRLSLAAQAERSWDVGDPKGSDVLSLTLMADRPIADGEGVVSLGLTLEGGRSTFSNSTYDAARLALHVDPGWQIGPADISFGATAALRDYDVFSIGFANVTDGRTDRSFGLSVDMAIEGWSTMGFAPVISLRHGQTHSNISRYETSTTGISIGLTSVF